MGCHRSQFRDRFSDGSVSGKRGASLRLVCRNPERAATAQDIIRKAATDADVTIHLADMSELAQVDALCETLTGPIHGIVHNAGNMLDDYQETSTGHEVISALHVLGPVRMTEQLHSQLIDGASDHSCRIIFVASGGMYTQKLDALALEPTPHDYDGTVHYARTKRAQVVLARHLHAQLKDLGISVHSMHPGWADTPAVRRAMPKFYWFTKGILRSPEQGADTVVWLACCPPDHIHENGFWFDRRRVPTHAFKKTRHTKAAEVAFIEQLNGLLPLDSSRTLHIFCASVK